jgi:hypothetical protein
MIWAIVAAGLGGAITGALLAARRRGRLRIEFTIERNGRNDD